MGCCVLRMDGWVGEIVDGLVCYKTLCCKVVMRSSKTSNEPEARDGCHPFCSYSLALMAVQKSLFTSK